MLKNNQLKKLLGIEFPIIQAPMAGGATTPALVAAVSNAGGLGSLGAGYMSAQDLRKAISDIRACTERSFNVNLFIPEIHAVTGALMVQACEDVNKACEGLKIGVLPPSPPFSQAFDEQIEIIFEEKVPVFSFTFGLLDKKWIRRLKKNKTILIGTATSLAEAKAHEECGIDLIVLQGREAGGHSGLFLNNTSESLLSRESLLKACVGNLSLPLIVAGGLMNAAMCAEALKQGAQGVQLGTAFLTTTESGIHPGYKKALLSAKSGSTVLTRAFSGKLARGINNVFIENMKDNVPLDYPIQNALTSVIRQKAKAENNPDYMSLWAGEGVQQCQSLGAGELMSQLIKGVGEHLLS
jgi:nitronate monooxygenase